jgi:CRP/FNR family transcriptional regulator, cyclic AMP receptor protein
MTTLSPAEQLAQVPLFRNLPRKALEGLGKIARSREFAPGQVLMEEGGGGVGVFLIVDGEVEVSRRGSVVATLGPGDVLGEMAVLDDAPRSATATARTPTRCLVIVRWDFLPSLKQEPEIAVELVRALSARLRKMDERLDEI